MTSGSEFVIRKPLWSRDTQPSVTGRLDWSGVQIISPSLTAED